MIESNLIWILPHSYLSTLYINFSVYFFFNVQMVKCDTTWGSLVRVLYSSLQHFHVHTRAYVHMLYFLSALAVVAFIFLNHIDSFCCLHTLNTFCRSILDLSSDVYFISTICFVSQYVCLCMCLLLLSLYTLVKHCTVN